MYNPDCLNQVQRQAAQDTEGAVVVFAGAGSGKTRVLTHRVAYLVREKNVPPYNILAITFTNKATNEMKERLLDMIGPCDIWISTFHSLCTKILFVYAEKLGYTGNFSIFDDSASRRILQRVLREKHLDEDKEDRYLWHIANAKNMGLDSDGYFDIIAKSEKDAMTVTEVFDRYNEVLYENNAMDFDDLLINCVKLFKQFPDVLEHYQNRFKYIHVDEFQDTNPVQMELVKLLAGKWGNVFVVGDDDQSIYGWRGANVGNIVDFDRHFADVKIYKLQQNYRSTESILNCANNLIKNNVHRVSKVLTTDVKGGARVEFSFHSDEHREVDNVIFTIFQLKRHNNYRNKDFAILVRQNSLTRLYEINLTNMNVPYRVFGGFRFFDRKEIQDLIAYLRVLANPRDSEAILRIINFPARGIGNATIDRLQAYAKVRSIPLFEAIAEVRAADDIPSAAKTKVAAFADLINSFAVDLHTMKFSDFVENMVKRLNLEAFYAFSDKEEERNRWENIQEFLTHVKENFDDENASIEDFLHSVTLENEVRNDEDDDCVTISTMHAAKGLEFKVVFIVACEEQILPSAKSLMERDGIEEERRVMYVAITRARERLYISCVNGTRMRFGRTEHTRPSRFIDEAKGIDKSFLPEKVERMRKDAYFDDYEDPIPKANQIKKIDFVPNVKIDNKPEIKTGDTSKFVSGAKVKHKKYGIGTIIITEGTGMGKTVTVAFEDLGIKKFSASSAPLTLV